MEASSASWRVRCSTCWTSGCVSAFPPACVSYTLWVVAQPARLSAFNFQAFLQAQASGISRVACQNARSVWLPAPSALLASSAGQGCGRPSGSLCVGAGMLPWRIVRQHCRMWPYQHPRERVLTYRGSMRAWTCSIVLQRCEVGMQSVPRSLWPAWHKHP